MAPPRAEMVKAMESEALAWVRTLCMTLSRTRMVISAFPCTGGWTSSRTFVTMWATYEESDTQRYVQLALLRLAKLRTRSERVRLPSSLSYGSIMKSPRLLLSDAQLLTPKDMMQSSLSTGTVLFALTIDSNHKVLSISLV